ncbi:PPOX class F420-dependent oxidoreductase [Nocardia takedensis]
MELDSDTRQLLDGRNFATVATLEADGSPHTSVVWIARDGDVILFGTTAGRRKARNLARDPRVAVTVFDTANPYRTVDIRGTAQLVDDPDKSLPKTLSRKYLGQDQPEESPEIRRLIVRVTPHTVTGFRGTRTHEPDPTGTVSDTSRNLGRG